MELILFLIVSGIIWFLGQKFGDDPDAPRPPVRHDHTPSQQPSRPDPTAHMTQDERTRRIQEEIRRKIAARREQRAQQGEAPPPLPREEPDYPLQPWEEDEPAYPRQQEPSYPSHQESQYPRRKLDYGRPNEPKPTDVFQEVYGDLDQDSPFFQSSSPARNYEAELDEQRRKLEESQRRAAAARQQAQSQLQKVYGQPTGRRERRSYSGLALAKRVKARLQDPEAAREAFLHMEILGTPVGQRVNGKISRSWES